MGIDTFLKLNGIDGDGMVRSVEARGLAQFVQRLNRAGLHLAVTRIDDKPASADQVKSVLTAAGLRTAPAAQPARRGDHREWILIESIGNPY